MTQAKRLGLIATNAVEVVKRMTRTTIKPSDVERRLHAKGFTLREIGTIVGLSHQRVDQLLR